MDVNPLNSGVFPPVCWGCGKHYAEFESCYKELCRWCWLEGIDMQIRKPKP